MTYVHAYVALAGFLGASGVAMGAFGAHALKDVLDARHTALWQTASQYHLVHASALLAAAALRLAATREASGVGANGLFWHIGLGCLVLGTVLFSGSLYALALGAPHMLGIVTPIGGLALIAGWVTLFGLGLTAFGA